VNDPGATFRLRVATDPALGVTVRTFVRSSAPALGLHDEDVETLCLAATELLANAVEAGEPVLELTLEAVDGRWTLRAAGVGPLRTVADAEIDRRALLMGLAALAVGPGGDVELSAAVTD
jgi:anti-sigma regulatory factor (Ser/Thr protein kinase)